MVSITQVTARQILDSRGRPTVEASVQLSDGTLATSSVPSGAINNEKHEAIELRDNKPNEYFGYGVTQAVNNVNSVISPALVGKDPLYQTQIDQTLVDLDGTKNKSKLGANAILAVSQAVMKAAAASLRLPLFVYVKEKYKLIDAYRIPTPIFNLINGGRHGSGTLDFQEFQLVPASHLPYPQALRIGVEFFLGIEKALEQKGAITTVGLEGGFSPNLAANADALEIFNEAAKLTSYTISQDAFLGIDLGPSHFYKGSKYNIKDRPQPLASKDFIKYLKDLHEQYRVFAFEDPLVIDAWSDWKTLTAELGETAMIVADDLVATNKTLLIKAIQEKACNAIAVKPNRIGTVTEAIEIVSIAKQAGWHTIMSHRSSETTDDFLADLAVGIGTDYVKFGAPSRGERVAKYNRLLRIEEILRASQPESASAGTSPSAPPAQSGAGAVFGTQTPAAAPAAPNPSPSPEPATQPSLEPTSLPSWMTGAAMGNNTPAGSSAAPPTTNISGSEPVETQPLASTPAATQTPSSPNVSQTPEPLTDASSQPLPELSVTPPPAVEAPPSPTEAPPAPATPTPVPTPSPVLPSEPIETAMPASPAPPVGRENVPPAAPQPTVPSTPMPSAAPPMPPSGTPNVSGGLPLPTSPGFASPGAPAVTAPNPVAPEVNPTTEPEADNIQNSLNELAEMVSSAPSASPAAPASAPAAPPVAEVPPAPTAPVTQPAPVTLGNEPASTAAPNATPASGGLPRPVPPKFE